MNKLSLFFLLLFTSTHCLSAKPDIGDRAPDFEITQFNGENFKLSDYQGKKSVFLVFWNSWCTNCFKKIPQLKALQEKHADEIKIIAINTTRKDSMEDSLEFKKRFDINYALAFDHGKKVTDLYQAKFVPYAFIIDINGTVQLRDNIPENIESKLEEWNKPNQMQLN